MKDKHTFIKVINNGGVLSLQITCEFAEDRPCITDFDGEAYFCDFCGDVVAFTESNNLVFCVS
jgi:hypothetical protein